MTKNETQIFEIEERLHKLMQEDDGTSSSWSVSHSNTPILKNSHNPNLIQSTRAPNGTNFSNNLSSSQLKMKQNASKNSLLSINTANSAKSFQPGQN